MEYAAEALSDEASEITPNDLAGDYACIAEIIGIENTIYYISTIAVSKSHFLNVYILFNMS